MIEENRQRERREIERAQREKEKQEKEARERARQRKQQAACVESHRSFPSGSRWEDPYGIPPQPNPKDKSRGPIPSPWDVTFRPVEAKQRRQ